MAPSNHWQDKETHATIGSVRKEQEMQPTKKYIRTMVIVTGMIAGMAGSTIAAMPMLVIVGEIPDIAPVFIPVAGGVMGYIVGLLGFSVINARFSQNHS